MAGLLYTGFTEVRSYGEADGGTQPDIYNPNNGCTEQALIGFN